MVLGDFNAKHSAWYDRRGTDAQGAALKLLTDSHGLHQIIASPTYNVDSDNPSLLDFIFTSQSQTVLSSAVLCPVANHCAVWAQLSLRKAVPRRPYRVEKFVFGDADVTGLQAHLASFDWSCLNDRDINSAVEQWTSIFL